MNLGDMRTLVRLRAQDTGTADPRWTDTQIDIELNHAAKFEAREISKSQRINYFAATESFTTSGTTKAYALAATDIRRIYKVVRHESSFDEPCKVIEEPDRLNLKLPIKDDQGRWVMYVTRDATTKLFSINFPLAVPSGMNFLVQYIQRIADLTAGGSSSQEFTAIDEDFHELVCQRAIIQLLGPDGAGLQAATNYYSELSSQRDEDLRAATDGSYIEDEFQRP